MEAKPTPKPKPKPRRNFPPDCYRDFDYGPPDISVPSKRICAGCGCIRQTFAPDSLCVDCIQSHVR